MQPIIFSTHQTCKKMDFNPRQEVRIEVGQDWPGVENG